MAIRRDVKSVATVRKRIVARVEKRSSGNRVPRTIDRQLILDGHIGVIGIHYDHSELSLPIAIPYFDGDPIRLRSAEVIGKANVDFEDILAAMYVWEIFRAAAETSTGR